MTGAQVEVLPKRVPRFRPGRELRALVNGEGDEDVRKIVEI